MLSLSVVNPNRVYSWFHVAKHLTFNCKLRQKNDKFVQLMLIAQSTDSPSISLYFHTSQLSVGYTPNERGAERAKNAVSINEALCYNLQYP